MLDGPTRTLAISLINSANRQTLANALRELLDVEYKAHQEAAGVPNTQEDGWYADGMTDAVLTVCRSLEKEKHPVKVVSVTG